MMARLAGRHWSAASILLTFVLLLLGLTFLPLSRDAAIESPVNIEAGQRQHDAQIHKDEAEQAAIRHGHEHDDQKPTQPSLKPPMAPLDTEELSKTSEAEPANTPYRKTVVMGKLSTEDTEWVQYLQDWQSAIYVVDLANDTASSPTGFRTKMNKAKEAMPYLTYIVDHYPDFPDIVAFVHSHRNLMPAAWHTDARKHDAVNMLNDLKTEAILEKGFANMRCNNEVGCPAEVQPWRDPFDPEKHTEHAFPHVYATFFNMSMKEVQERIPVVAAACCAQFAVSRKQLLDRPKEDYERYMRYLEETQYDDDTSGRIMEYMWHIIFGKPPVHCPDANQCYCDLYHRCKRPLGPGSW